MTLELPPADPTPELMFGLVAPIGVDLGTVSEILSVTLHEMHYEAHLLRVTELMREIRINIDPQVSDDLLPEQSHIASYRERIAYANAIRAKFGYLLNPAE